MIRRPAACLVIALLSALPAAAQSSLSKEVDRHAASVEAKVVTWRRDIHAHPELSNEEKRTAQLVADHLRRLGLEVRTGVGGTGVVGVLRGGRPGPVVALRADMDALPVTEETDLPFKSTVRAQFNGQEVGVMHACGHDLHVAILMGAAEVLSNMRASLPGTVKFIFQPAEEASGTGPGGALAMLRDGALENPAPAAIFGLHVFSGSPAGWHEPVRQPDRLGWTAPGSQVPRAAEGGHLPAEAGRNLSDKQTGWGGPLTAVAPLRD